MKENREAQFIVYYLIMAADSMLHYPVSFL